MGKYYVRTLSEVILVFNSQQRGFDIVSCCLSLKDGLLLKVYSCFNSASSMWDDKT